MSARMKGRGARRAWFSRMPLQEEAHERWLALQDAEVVLSELEALARAAQREAQQRASELSDVERELKRLSGEREALDARIGAELRVRAHVEEVVWARARAEARARRQGGGGDDARGALNTGEQPPQEPVRRSRQVDWRRRSWRAFVCLVVVAQSTWTRGSWRGSPRRACGCPRRRRRRPSPAAASRSECLDAW